MRPSPGQGSAGASGRERPRAGASRMRSQMRSHPTETSAALSARNAGPRFGAHTDLTGSFAAPIATPRGRLRGLLLAYRVLGQVRLSAAWGSAPLSAGLAEV